MKVYIAGPACEKDYVCHVKLLLQQSGFTVVSTWADQRDVGYEDPGVTERLAGAAVQDFKEVASCDLLLILSMTGSRGGMHSELGIALALDKELILIGQRTQVFHYHHKVRQYDFIETWMKSF